MKPKVLSQVIIIYIKTAYALSSAQNSHRSAAVSFHWALGIEKALWTVLSKALWKELVKVLSKVLLKELSL
jgi:hypothetical protein